MLQDVGMNSVLSVARKTVVYQADLGSFLAQNGFILFWLKLIKKRLRIFSWGLFRLVKFNLPLCLMN
jgi:hypothetical protein